MVKFKYVLNKDTILTPKKAGEALIEMKRGCIYAIEMHLESLYDITYILHHRGKETPLTSMQTLDLMDRSSEYVEEVD